MKKLKLSLIAGLMAISSVGYGQDNLKQEKDERVEVFYVDHRDYDIRVGEELNNFGWIMRRGVMLCRYDKGFNKVYVNQDTFDSNRCPKKLIGVKKVKKQSVDE
ncbi:MAG: hypothetical protein ACI936_001051 [Paraglaciecola sp.]|jgi:hypothetical protein